MNKILADLKNLSNDRMNIIVIGINAQHSNSSACVSFNGVIEFAIEEERLKRVKNYNGFPYLSLLSCLEFIKRKTGKTDYHYLAINNNPLSNLNNKIYKFILLDGNYHKALKNFFKKYFIDQFNYYKIKKEKIIHINHHLSHISSAFLNSNYKNAIGLTLDGFGDSMSMGIYLCHTNKIKLLHKISYPHSLGIFYQSITQYLDFKNYGDEYKVMGLAAYGKKYLKEVDTLISYKNKYDYKLNLDFFSYKYFGSQLTEEGIPFFNDLFNKKKFDDLFKYAKNKDLKNFKKNLAYSAQEKFSEIVLKIISDLKKDYKNYDNLCLAGGCFFNSDTVGKIIKNKIFPNIFVYPNPGDAGGAVGAVLQANHKLNIAHINKKKKKLVYIGPSFANKEVEKSYLEFKAINNISYNVNFITKFNELNSFVANKISKGKIVAWFQDEMEWGQRALGNRSILADPRKKIIINIINKKIKKREKFRPFAGSVLKEYAKDFFEINANEESPYMLGVYPVNMNKRHKILGITHVNNTCRIQTVSKNDNKKFYDLIYAFYKITNIPILLNTSFNINEPIVCNPMDALNTFHKSDIDYLVIQNFIFKK